MENGDDIVLFAKEMLRQGPSRNMLKVYMLGSTLAVLGMVGGLVEKVFLPFLDSRVIEEEQAELFLEKMKERKQMLKLQSTFVHPEADGMLGVVLSEDKPKHLGPPMRRNSAIRLHS